MTRPECRKGAAVARLPFILTPRRPPSPIPVCLRAALLERAQRKVVGQSEELFIAESALFLIRLTCLQLDL